MHDPSHLQLSRPGRFLTLGSKNWVYRSGTIQKGSMARVATDRLDSSREVA